MALPLPKIVYNSPETTLLFTLPPVKKPAKDQRTAARHDTVTSSGIKQSIFERIDIFKTLTMEYVPVADADDWQDFMEFALAGNSFLYYPDASVDEFQEYTLEDTDWNPQRNFRSYDKFTLKLRSTDVSAAVQGGAGTIGTRFPSILVGTHAERLSSTYYPWKLGTGLDTHHRVPFWEKDLKALYITQDSVGTVDVAGTTVSLRVDVSDFGDYFHADWPNGLHITIGATTAKIVSVAAQLDPATPVSSVELEIDTDLGALTAATYTVKSGKWRGMYVEEMASLTGDEIIFDLKRSYSFRVRLIADAIAFATDGVPGQIYHFLIEQAADDGWAFIWPTNFIGGLDMPTDEGAAIFQSFVCRRTDGGPLEFWATPFRGVPFGSPTGSDGGNEIAGGGGGANSKFLVWLPTQGLAGDAGYVELPFTFPCELSFADSLAVVRTHPDVLDSATYTFYKNGVEIGTLVITHSDYLFVGVPTTFDIGDILKVVWPSDDMIADVFISLAFTRT